MELIFTYGAGRSFLHRADPRLKLPALIVLSVAVAGAGPTPLALLFAALTALLAVSCGLRRARASLFSLARFMLVVLLFIAVALLFQGDAPDSKLLLPFLLRLPCWILLGFLLTATTSSASLRAGVYAGFRLIPGLRAALPALLISITIGTVPLFFRTLRRNREALAVRGRIPWYRPLRRIRTAVLPLMTGMLRRADSLSDSLVSRGFSADRKFDLPALSGTETLRWTLLLSGLLFFMYLPPLLGYTQ